MRPPTVDAGVLSQAVLLLAVLGGVLVVAALITADPPRAPVPDRAGHLRRWQARHGGHDPRASAWLRGWLAVAWWLARPLARGGVSPHVLTAASAWLAAAALLAAAAGGRWAVAAAWLVLLSGVGDGLDGAVAVLTDRATRLGSLLDALVDRVGELAFAGAVALVGGSGVTAGLAAACAALFWLHEYLRARAAVARTGEVVAVTVAERPQRVIVLAVTLHAAGVAPAGAEAISAAGLAVMLVLAAAGFVQLAVAAWRRLGDADAGDGGAGGLEGAEGAEGAERGEAGGGGEGGGAGGAGGRGD